MSKNNEYHFDDLYDDIADDLYVVQFGPNKGKIYFCGDSFYGYYGVKEFADLLSALLKQYRKIVEEICDGKDH